MGTKQWLDKKLYPFENKTMQIQGYSMNYIDEGSGPVVLMVHGTPSWSFEYRHMVEHLKASFRCIAPDYLGFGLSEKPDDIDYRPQGHFERLKEFIRALNLSKIHLVAHDFGGPVGFACAMDMPERFQKITLINTWMWSLAEYAHFQRPSKIIATGIGKFLYEKLNFSVNVLLKSGFYDKKKLTKEVFKQYQKAQDKAARKAAYRLALALLGESDWYESLWKQKSKIEPLLLNIVWGMEDKLLPAQLLLEKWTKGFPRAKLIRMDRSGHFPQEEEAEFVSRVIMN